jgi:N-acyl-D-aspartate/D-glutamate deacylase
MAHEHARSTRHGRYLRQRRLRRRRFARAATFSLSSIETAVHRWTGEIADWLGIAAGHVRPGDRADVVVIDPEALDTRLDAYHEAQMESFGDLMRMVNRSDGIVDAVIVNGRIAFENGKVAAELGRARGLGTFLRARAA